MEHSRAMLGQRAAAHAASEDVGEVKHLNVGERAGWVRAQRLRRAAAVVDAQHLHRLQRLQSLALGRRGPFILRKRSVVLSFPCACPKPVLVKQSLYTYILVRIHIYMYG
eukprot:COSAG06_NODE_7313_length_2549_cov_48.716735_3_plen_110_part_00